MGISKEKIAELTATHGRIRHVVGDGGEWECVLKPPSGPDAKMYKHQIHDPANRPDAQEVIWRKMVVASWVATFPQPEDAMEIVGKDVESNELLRFFPLAPEGCSDAIGALAGMKTAERTK